MSHLRQETLSGLLRGDGGAREIEEAAEHLVSCETCRAMTATLLDELRAIDPVLKAKGSLRSVLDVIDRERQWAIEPLKAFAEWAEICSLPSRRSQRDRVRMSKACHTLPFFNLLLDKLKEETSWEQAEFLASLAILASEAMAREGQISGSRHHDHQAQVWTSVANARRLAAEWQRAHQALANAERHLAEGTAQPLLKAGLYSIAASTLADEGQFLQAMEALEKCQSIYQDQSETTCLARTLIQVARVLVGPEPARALSTLDRAAPLIPAGETNLTLLSDLLRVECLIELRRTSEALRVFRGCSRLLRATPRKQSQIRGSFTGARLLDALGLRAQAERLFAEAIDRDIEHELYKDAFLDLLYLYGRFMDSGDLEGAARVCRRALDDPALANVAHDQMRDLWEQLLQATRHQALSKDRLDDLRRYLSVHWKHPAPTPPVVRSR